MHVIYLLKERKSKSEHCKLIVMLAVILYPKPIRKLLHLKDNSFQIDKAKYEHYNLQNVMGNQE